MDNKKTIILTVLLVLALIILGTVIKLIKNSDDYLVEKSFTAFVLENNGSSILVKPVEGTSESNSSDKIVVRVPVDNATLKDLSEFTEGSKVKITYDGMIMESYPAQINAFDVELMK